MCLSVVDVCIVVPCVLPIDVDVPTVLPVVSVSPFDSDLASLSLVPPLVPSFVENCFG